MLKVHKDLWVLLAKSKPLSRRKPMKKSSTLTNNETAGKSFKNFCSQSKPLIMRGREAKKSQSDERIRKKKIEGISCCLVVSQDGAFICCFSPWLWLALAKGLIELREKLAKGFRTFAYRSIIYFYSRRFLIFESLFVHISSTPIFVINFNESFS